MYDFVMHVNRRAVSFQRQLDDIHCAHDTGTETPRPYPQQYFSIRSSRHCCPKYIVSEDSIIPYGVPGLHPVSSKGALSSSMDSHSLKAVRLNSWTIAGKKYGEEGPHRVNTGGTMKIIPSIGRASERADTKKAEF